MAITEEQRAQNQAIREEWIRNAPDRLNRATIESGVIPHLHQQFEQKGLMEFYAVVDAVELTRGFPFGAFTRYIVPVVTEGGNWLNPDKDTVYPGLVVIDLHASQRTLYIQLGLEGEDMRKAAVANDAFSKLYPGREVPTTKPDWWTYSFPDFMTYLKPQDYQTGNKDLELFAWGGTSDKRVVQLEFEREAVGGKIKPLWNPNSPKLTHGLEIQNSIIDTLLDIMPEEGIQE